jgi:hypothetical protein
VKRLLVELPLNPAYSTISYENIIFPFMTFSFAPTFPGTQLECKIRLRVFLSAMWDALACSQPECNNSTKKSSKILHYSKISSHFCYRTAESIINQSANGALAKYVCKFAFTLPRSGDIFSYKETQFFSVDIIKMGFKGISCADVNSIWLGM